MPQTYMVAVGPGAVGRIRAVAVSCSRSGGPPPASLGTSTDAQVCISTTYVMLSFGRSPKANAQRSFMAETAADRGREVRRRLVQAARELVPERGWAAVSTRTVAERAGVAPGLVHYHFASLQALLAEAAVGAMRDLAGS